MRVGVTVAVVLTAVSIGIGAGQTPELRITSPPADAIVTGATHVEATLDPSIAVSSVRFTVNGRLLCTVEQRPFRCPWNAGAVLQPYHIRAVATLATGESLVANVRTKNLGYTERARVDAVLVRVIVTDRGRFVRGLTKADFELLEDGVPQRIDSLVSEESALDLVMAMDISGSMEGALDDVKVAVKQFVTKLRPGDAATLVGFNDSMFIAAERETEAAARAAAVDLMAAWGGTAIYDATVRVLDMVSPESGRKGVVIFSDGADQNSMTTREAAAERVQASDAMLYAIGFGGGVTVPTLRTSLETYAQSTGGRAFFPRHTGELDGVFKEILEELANQYVLSYTSTNIKQDNAWRAISVKVRKKNVDVRARRGYRQQGLPRSGGK